MSDSMDFDTDASTRTQAAGYTSKHPIPNIQQYKEKAKERNQRENVQGDVQVDGNQQEPRHSLLRSARERIGLKSSSEGADGKSSYHSANRNVDGGHGQEDSDDTSAEAEPLEKGDADKSGGDLQAVNAATDPRQKRKNAKHMQRDTTGREVTDPVTHLKVRIHDQTERHLQRLPENEDPQEKAPIQDQIDHTESAHVAMERLFPPPRFNRAENQIVDIVRLYFIVGIGSLFAIAFLLLVLQISTGRNQTVVLFISSVILSLSAFALYTTVQSIVRKKISSICEDEVWAAEKDADHAPPQRNIPESTQWLNSVLNSVWALINPDLFTSLADTLEDVMQASLPKMVRMISVEDIGQGSEAIRILGIKWLPAGAASKNVSLDGEIESDMSKESDRLVPGQEKLDLDESSRETEPSQSQDRHSDDVGKNDSSADTNDENVAEGMEAEEGDFVNVELGFAYRASSNKGKNLRSRAKNAHLYLAFYLPGGIRLPVWVELRGIVGIMRMRLQLCPDPPFFSLCTLTLLGQPKAQLTCVPLTKKGLNIMDLPIISSFVQSSIDAALAEYVAPKSLTLDLKEMLMGDGFKKDTMCRGVLVVRIRRGKGFKEGDPGFAGLTKGSTDGYVTVGWAKYGKPVWSTRVIVGDMSPCWEEIGFVPVGPEELNADERLRVQLWDSDRSSADDDLGKIEVELRELTHNPRYAGKMFDRDDGFAGMSADESVPGSLQWSVGYFTKTTLREYDLKAQKTKPDVDSEHQLKEKVSKDVSHKMREASDKNESTETNQQKAQDLKEKEDEMIISMAPLHDYPSGILSVQIHNITGLEFEKLSKDDRAEGDDTDEFSDDLPSAYCTIILNHQKIFTTRTKPKNAKPFFNAGTERIIRDWRTAEVIVSVRDSRVHENDPLLGIVYLPMNKLFKQKSQLVESYPLMSGIGYGRIRLSMVFRSIKYQAPRELCGWDFGTLEITKPIHAKDLAPDLAGLRLKVQTSVSHCKMYTAGSDGPSAWTGKKERPVRLAVKKRYAASLVIEFRKHRAGPDITPAFAVLWLKDIPDDEETPMTLPIWRSDGDNLKRAGSNCLEDVGQKVGSLVVSLKFWRGLSDYHRKLASKNASLAEVFEVLSVAKDSREVRDMIADQDSDSDSSESDEEHNPLKGLSHKVQSFSKLGSDNDEDEGKRGPLDQFKDYGDHSKQLHRQNRGIMQHKAPRTAAWMKTKLEHGKDRVMDSFKHHDREPDVETEV